MVPYNSSVGTIAYRSSTSILSATGAAFLAPISCCVRMKIAKKSSLGKLTSLGMADLPGIEKQADDPACASFSATALPTSLPAPPSPTGTELELSNNLKLGKINAPSTKVWIILGISIAGILILAKGTR